MPKIAIRTQSARLGRAGRMGDEALAALSVAVTVGRGLGAGVAPVDTGVEGAQCVLGSVDMELRPLPVGLLCCPYILTDFEIEWRADS